MKTQEKKNYSAPALTVVSFVMERGFAGSVGTNSNIEQINVKSEYGKEESTNSFWN